MTRKRTHEEYDSIIFERELSCFPIEPYQTNHVPILHKCVGCGHEWKIKPAHVLAEHGCRLCYDNKRRKFEDPKPDKTKVYYVRLAKDGKVFYKLGVSRNITHRFMSESDKLITVLKLWYFETRREAFDFEQNLLKQYKSLRNKEKFLNAGGDTELFPLDILNLDKG